MKEKIPIFFLFDDFRISGVLTFAADFIEHINSNYTNYDAKILCLKHPKEDELYVLDDYDTKVEILFDKNNYSQLEKLNFLLEYLNSFKKCIVFGNFYFQYHVILPFLHDGVKKIFVLHSDEEIYYHQARLFSSYFDCIVSVSKHIGKNLLSKDKSLFKKHNVIPCGIIQKSDYNHYFYDNRCLEVVYFGRLVEQQKKISRMINIIKNLTSQNKKFKWYFIGDGSERKFLINSLNKEIEQGIVKVLSPLSPKKLRKLIKKFDVYILTSDYEGTPVALIEAMNAGCVPVVSNVSSGINELIENDIEGFIVEKDNIMDYVNKLIFLANNRDVLKKMSFKSHKKVQSKYAIDTTVQKYVSLFNKMKFKNNVLCSELNKLDLSIYFNIVEAYLENKFISILRNMKAVAVFGLGVSGQKTFDFLESSFPGIVKLFIDDFKKGEYFGIPIVSTELFLKDYQDKVECVVYGGLQKLNPNLIPNLIIPNLRLEHIV